ncbi:MAG: hypothetical protein LRS46_00405 [Desulfurococcales archaeon]|nr:hypothetical protein [Desulfurococcales archaeon]
MSKPIPAGGPYKAALGLHEALTATHIEVARRALFNYCLGEHRLCATYIKLISEVSKLVARARFEDLVYDESYRGSDADFFKIIRSSLEVYATALAGMLAGDGDKVLVRILRPVTVNGKLLDRDDLVLLTLSEAAFLAALGYVRAEESNILKLALQGEAGGGLDSGGSKHEIPKED